MEAIFEKARAGEEAGGDFFEVGWQSTLEIWQNSCCTNGYDCQY